jgi:hypothetical protein
MRSMTYRKQSILWCFTALLSLASCALLKSSDPTGLISKLPSVNKWLPSSVTWALCWRDSRCASPNRPTLTLDLLNLQSTN